MNSLCEESRRSLFTWKMLIAILLMFAVALRALLMNNVFSYQTNVFTLYSDCFAASGMSYFIVLIATIPYATTFCEEHNSGYDKYILSKIGLNNYYMRRLFSTLLSGTVAIGVSLVIIFSIILMLGKPFTLEDISVLENGIWHSILTKGGILLFFALKLYLGMIYGAVWATAGFAISTWFTNKYVTILTPFAINQILWIVLNKYPYINPLAMFRGDFGSQNYFIGSFTYILFFQLTLLFIFSTLGYAGMKRRLKNV